MSDTARATTPLDIVSIEGLDSFFDVDASRVEEGANQEIHGREQYASVSVEEAAGILQISPRAVQKRLKRGTLKGIKSKHGAVDRWSVDLSDVVIIESQNMDVSGVLEDANFDPIGRVLDANCEEKDANKFSGGRVQDANGVSDYKDSLIKELQNKLEAATYRVGYLQHQVESQDQQIKLLSDSQQKPSWWQRIKEIFYRH